MTDTAQAGAQQLSPGRATPASEYGETLRGRQVVIRGRDGFYHGYRAWSDPFVDRLTRLSAWIVSERDFWRYTYLGTMPDKQAAYSIKDLWVEDDFVPL